MLISARYLPPPGAPHSVSNDKLRSPKPKKNQKPKQKNKKNLTMGGDDEDNEMVTLRSSDEEKFEVEQEVAL